MGSMNTPKSSHNRITRMRRALVALVSAAVLVTAMAPAGAAVAAGADDAPAQAAKGGGADDKCRQIKNRKKRKRCFANHERPGHHKGEDPPNHG